MEIRIVVDRSDAVISALENRIPSLLEEIGQHVSGEAALELANPPKRIDTGTLQGSIESNVDGGSKTVIIGTNVEYAIYVHDGTYKMAPNRFLRNACEKNVDQIRSKLEEALSGV